MKNPIDPKNLMPAKDIPFRSKFYTSNDGHVYTKLRPTSHLSEFFVWAINEEMELKSFALDTVVYHTY